MLDQPRDLYLCHDFEEDEGEPWLVATRDGRRCRRGSPMALGEALQASGYPSSRIYWSRGAVVPDGPVALRIEGRRITLPSAALASPILDYR